MVYEARQGEVFQLGASSWRIEQITRDRVLVSPAPGVPGRMPFWKGDGVGRPYELGRAVGEAARTRRFSDLDHRAARNLHAYLDDQEAATGVIPSDRTIVVERFRDEIGDWRVCVLSPFGGRVHAPWALALEQRMSRVMGIEVEAMWADDGIAIRLPDSDTPPPLDLIAIEPGDLDDLLLERVSQSPLFAARFRENAARALLLPRRRPGRRTPLWQQRLKAHDLQQVAVKFGSFPILLETYREVLSDVFEVPALKALLEAIGRGQVRMVEVESAQPSPFASALLFDYIATYMYEGDAPAAERRAQALQLDRALLAELLRADDLRELLDGEAIGQVEHELQGEGRAPTIDQAHDQLRRLGDLSAAEADARGIAAHIADLVSQRRAVAVRIAGEERFIAADDAGLYRDGLGVVPPPGLPAAYLEPAPDALQRLVLRYARTHGPFAADDLRARYGVDPGPALARLAAEGAVIEGGFRPGTGGREWIAPDVLRRVRRRTLAAIRRAVEPVEVEALARFLPAWQGVGRDSGRGLDRLRDVVAQLQGIALPVSAWETDVLPVRVPGYRPDMLDELCAGGELVWIGAGAGRAALYLRGEAALLHTPGEPSEHPIAAALRARGPLFFADLVAAVGEPDRTVLAELWALAWAGVTTNDSWHPLRGGAVLRALPPPSPAGSRPVGAAVPADLVAAGGPRPLVARREPRRGRARAGRAGARTRRDAARSPWRADPRCRAGRGRSRRLCGRLRGAADDGGGGPLPAWLLRRGAGRRAVRRPHRGRAAARRAQRRSRSAGGRACGDRPANPYGATLPWPASARRTARVAGAWIVTAAGRPALYVERGGRGLVTFDPELLEPAVAALADLVASGRARRLAPERIDGEPIAGTEAERLLLAHGFLKGHRRAGPACLRGTRWCSRRAGSSRWSASTSPRASSPAPMWPRSRRGASTCSCTGKTGAACTSTWA